jgi:IS30 family transposase
MLKRAPSTISREVAAHGGRQKYRAWVGEQSADELASRARPGKLDASPKLRAFVEARLQLRWSPAQIAKRLKVDYPDNPAMQVSHETIYSSLYVQGRGAFRKELTKYLRQGHTKRGPSKLGQGRLVGMVNISERPAEAADRAVPGHWEGDLIIGKGQKSAMGTLVERSTRYVMLFALPYGRGAEQVREALTKKIQELPRELRRSLTWDQGSELAQHAQFTVDTGVQVYFCDPGRPWQRGSNENTNGLLRQYFPKGTDLSQHSAAELDRVARELNGRPRQTLGWRTPAEKLDEALAKRAA